MADARGPDGADQVDADEPTGSGRGSDSGGGADKDAAHVVEHLLRHPGELGAFIRSQREEARLSLRKLATLAGVSNPYLSQIERGLRNPSAEILQGIARALEISSETLYVRAGLLEHVEPELGVTEAIEQATELNDAQKATLLEMYRSFVRLAALDD